MPSHSPVFVTTRWSVVLSARTQDPRRSAEALEILCRTYWYPLYVFVRRQGYSPHDAQDLTQGFFARLLEKDVLERVGREKGRFRSFLLTVLKRFLADQRDKALAQKRGGGTQPISFDTRIAEQRFLGESSLELPADRLYERRWALTLLERAMDRMRAEYASQDRRREYERLKPCLTAGRGEIPYADLAAGLGMSEGAARVAVHRLRKRFRALFREEVAQTVAREEEIDDEVRHLMRALTA